MVSHHLGRRLSRVTFALCLCISPTCVAQDNTPIWQCLPEETFAALRIPNGTEVLDALRATKFGKVMFTDERKQAIVEACETHGGDQWAEYLDVLEQYDLATEDFFRLLSGETGYAVALTKDANDESMFLGLGWMQPGEELAAKFFEIIGKAIDEQDTETPITRFDLDLAGQSVMQLHFPESRTEYLDEFQLPEDYEEMTDDEQREAYQDAREAFQESLVETNVNVTVLLCQLGDRLLVAHQFAASAEDEIEDIDQRLSTLFARVIAAHSSGGSDGFAPRLASDPSVARAMSGEGLPVMELLADVRPIFQAARSEVDDPDQFEKWFRLFGLEELGPFALRQTADGPNWQTLVAMSLPAPRAGLMQLFDQQMHQIDAPQWVPASAVRYFQFSFDLGQAYETIKAEVMREFAEETAGGFQMAELQVKNFAQVELPELLSSLGNRHTIMTFGVQSIDLGVTDEDDVDEDLDTSVLDRMAVVWQLTDEVVWSKLLKVIAPFAGMAPGTEAAEEQGFSGYRMKGAQMEGGLFLGKGYLVLGIGEGVIETTLSALNNPPSGSNALRGSDLFATAGDLISLQPAMLGEVTDNDRYLRMVFRQLKEQFDQMERMFSGFDDENEDGMFVFDLMRAILPADDELDGLMGVSVSRMEVTDDGVFMDAVQEMPLP